MNNKGNVWIVGLFVLQILIIISFNFTLNLEHLLNINKIDPTFECVKIKVIQKIKNDYYSNKTEDFELDIYDYFVSVTYDEEKCHVILDGKHYVEIDIVYDHVYLCIASIEYDYDSWE